MMNIVSMKNWCNTRASSIPFINFKLNKQLKIRCSLIESKQVATHQTLDKSEKEKILSNKNAVDVRI